MHVVQLEAFGLDHLKFRSRSKPPFGDGDVLIRMRAASLNSRDYLTVTGTYNPRQPLPLVPCSDGLGEVVAVGVDVQRFRSGDRVMPCFAQGWVDGPFRSDFRRTTLGGPLDGTLAEYMVLAESGIVHAPGYLDDAEAATLPCAALTAWNAVVNHGRLEPGETVLIEGTGGVAVFALQFAVMCGARPIVISKSDDKLERACRLGAAETINYLREPDWHGQVKEMTDGKGVDLVIELGGKTTLEKAVRAVKASGQISLVGVLGGHVAPLNLPLVVMRNVRLQGVTVGSRADFDNMLVDMEGCRLKPIVDRIFDIRDAVSAFEYLESAEHFGKVCIRHEPGVD